MKTIYGNEVGECGSHIICNCPCHESGGDIKHFVGCCDRCPKCGEHCKTHEDIIRQEERRLEDQAVFGTGIDWIEEIK